MCTSGLSTLSDLGIKSNLLFINNVSFCLSKKEGMVANLSTYCYLLAPNQWGTGEPLFFILCHSEMEFFKIT